jgi:hypothetical protein
MENLFVASYLNGWFQDLPEARVLELADSIRSVSVPIAAATVILEVGMVALLLRPRVTLLLLGAIASMHLGIVLMSGIVFWKWLALDLALLVWLWRRRKSEELGRMYSLPGFVISLVLIAGIIAGFGENRFSWWNTRWIQVFEIEAVDAAGNTYLVDYSDFAPYTLFDLYEHEERRIQTRVYGMSLDQRLMEMLEVTDAQELGAFFSGPGKSGDAPAQRTQKRIFSDFVKHHFQHRNQTPGRTVAPFWLPSPSLHNRYLSAPALYRDQVPIVEVRLRVVEIYYSGSALHRIRDQVVHTVPIP